MTDRSASLNALVRWYDLECRLASPLRDFNRLDTDALITKCFLLGSVDPENSELTKAVLAGRRVADRHPLAFSPGTEECADIAVMVDVLRRANRAALAVHGSLQLEDPTYIVAITPYSDDTWIARLPSPLTTLVLRPDLEMLTNEIGRLVDAGFGPGLKWKAVPATRSRCGHCDHLHAAHAWYMADLGDDVDEVEAAFGPCNIDDCPCPEFI